MLLPAPPFGFEIAITGILPLSITTKAISLRYCCDKLYRMLILATSLCCSYSILPAISQRQALLVSE